MLHVDDEVLTAVRGCTAAGDVVRRGALADPSIRRMIAPVIAKCVRRIPGLPDSQIPGLPSGRPPCTLKHS
jgi:hypothetical protein